MNSVYERCEALLKEWGLNCFKLKSRPVTFSVKKGIVCYPESMEVEVEKTIYTFTSEYLMCRFLREKMKVPKKVVEKKKPSKKKYYPTGLPKYYDAMERTRRKH